MKKVGKIGITTASILTAVGIIVIVLLAYANKIVTALASEELQERFAAMDSVEVSYSDLNIDLKQGAIHLQNFTYSTDTIRYPELPFVCVSFQQLHTDHINWGAVIKDRHLNIKELTIDGLAVKVSIESQKRGNALEKLRGQISQLNIRKINLTRSNIELWQKGSALHVSIPDIELHSGRFSLDVDSGRLNRCDDVVIELNKGVNICTKDEGTEISASNIHKDKNGIVEVSGLQVNKQTTAVSSRYESERIAVAPVQLMDIIRSKVIELEYIEIQNGQAEMLENSSKFHLTLPHVNMRLGQMKYDLAAKQLLRCDSTYSLVLDSIHFRSKDGHSAVEVDRVQTTDSCIVAEGVRSQHQADGEQRISCEQVQLGKIDIQPLLEHQALRIPFLTLNRLSVHAVLNKRTDRLNTGKGQWVEMIETDERIVQYRDEQEQRESKVRKEMASKAESFLHTIAVGRLTLHDSTLSIRNKGNAYCLKLPHVDGRLYEINYDVQEGQYSCSDKRYSLRADAVDLLSSDGLYRLQIKHLETANRGAVVLQGIHGRNTMEKEEFAERKGNVPVTWSETQIASVRTSRVNLIEKIRSKEIDLDSVFITANSLTIYRDTRYPPKSPYEMPQEILARLSQPIHIHYIQLSSPRFEAQIRREIGGVGSILLSDIAMQATDLSNKQGMSFKCVLRHHVGSGTSEIHFTLNNDEQASFRVTADIRNLQGSDFESVTRPMLGVTADCQIGSLVASMDGNKKATTGSLCLQYSGLKTQLIQDEVPIQKMQKYAGLINTFAPMFLNKANPKDSHHEATVTPLGIERDTQRNFASYIITTLLDGVLHTTLSDFAYNKIMNNNK